jgi:pyruvate dehydrogenase E1 component alpha subunit
MPENRLNDGDQSQPDLESLYLQMLRSRFFELLVAQLWHAGLISGEMHLGTGEEAITAAIVDQLEDGDAMALDYRGTPALLMRGVDPLSLMLEFLGQPDGLCAGMGGHMHLHSKDHLAAAYGIVGATGPAGLGFALASKYLRPGRLAVAFFGEGALNQGMLMESFNLAVVWNLPVIFICKDDSWSTATASQDVRAGSVLERVRGFGMPALQVDGGDLWKSWVAARQAVMRARRGQGPTFLQAICVHLEGHFLGDPRLRITRQPLRELPGISAGLIKASLQLGGAPIRERLAGISMIVDGLLDYHRAHQFAGQNDPLVRARAHLDLDEDYLQVQEAAVAQEVLSVFKRALVEAKLPAATL